MDVAFARLAQGGEGGGVVAALGQAVAAVAERVRACGQPPVVRVAAARWLGGGDHLDVGDRERLPGVQGEFTTVWPRRPAGDPPGVFGAVVEAHADAFAVADRARRAPGEQVRLVASFRPRRDVL